MDISSAIFPTYLPGPVVFSPHLKLVGSSDVIPCALGIVVISPPFSICRMDDIQLCKEISRLKKELQKLIALPGELSTPSHSPGGLSALGAYFFHRVPRVAGMCMEPVSHFRQRGSVCRFLAL